MANKYLAVYTDWIIEALGQGVLAPNPDDPTASSGGVSLSVSSGLVNPITSSLAISVAAPSSSNEEPVAINYSATAREVVHRVLAPPHTENFSSSFPGTGLATIDLTGLTPGETYAWAVSITVELKYTSPGRCVPHNPGCIHRHTFYIWDTVGPVSDYTQWIMRTNPAPPLVKVQTTPGGWIPSLEWTNNGPFQATAALLPSGGGPALPPGNPSSQYQLSEDLVFPTVTSTTFTAEVNLLSEPGTEPSGWSVSLGGPSSSPGTSLSLNYPIDLSAAPQFLSFTVYDITTTSATLNWTALPSGILPSLVTVSEGTRQNATPTYQEIENIHYGVLCSPASPWACPYALYTARFTGLEPLTEYTAEATITANVSGVLYRSPDTLHFFTSGTFGLAPSDLPYDSITQEGGGENFQWSDPPVVDQQHAQFVDGYATYAPASGGTTTVMPLESLGAVPGASWEHQLNLSAGLTPNTLYGISMMLNYSVNGAPLSLWSDAGSQFWYLKDTSGDGLADSEKVYGWNVTYTDLQGTWNSHGVTANRADYATNGLVSDYIEKEFGLDARRLDTAGSHMLDTWNLTFDLGPLSNGAPKTTDGYYHWWDESAPFDPFDACPTPDYAGSCSFAPSTSNEPQNLSDDGPWASEQLWSYWTLLDTLNNLVINDKAGWLGGVLGSYDGEYTLTVWGKLSWGANPLAASTPADHLPDGARLNPLHDLDLQIGADTHGAGLLGSFSGCPGGLLNKMGFATRLYVNDSNQYWPHEFQGLTNQALVTCDGTTSTPEETLTLPVDNTVQYQNLQFNLVVNTSTAGSSASSAGPFKLLAVDGTSAVYSLTIDMLDPDPVASFYVQGSATGCSGDCTSLVGGIHVVPAGVKAPTYLWLPDDNSTLSNLPEGLQRYTGEQDFFLVVADVSAGSCSNCAFPSDAVPLPWGGTTTYTVHQDESSQLANFLIPRGQFLDSPMGQAILQGRTAADTTHGANAPVVGVPIWQIACHWQNDAVQPGGGTAPNTCSQTSPLEGTSPGQAAYVSVVSAAGLDCTTSPSAPNCAEGGVPLDSGLETGYASPALQGVVTLNLTSTSDLDYLLAGLLDNATGGVNGTFRDVTTQIMTLGLSPVVMSSLANTSEPNTGVYGMPTSEASPPPPSCTGLCSVWNAVGGVVDTVAGVVGVVWDATVAAATYLNDLVPGLKPLEEAAVAAAVSALKAVGQALEAALQALLAYIVKEVTALFNSAVAPIRSAEQSYVNNILTLLDPAGPEVIWDAIGGDVFALGLAIAVVAQIAIGILTGITLGVGTFVSQILISLLITFALTAVVVVIPAVASLGTATVDACQTVSASYNSQVGQATAWQTWAGTFSYWENGASTSYAFKALWSAYSDAKVGSLPFIAQAVSFGFALAGIAFGVQADVLQNSQPSIATIATITAVIFNAVSIVLEAMLLSKPSPTRSLDVAITAMDTGAFAMEYAEWQGGF